MILLNGPNTPFGRMCLVTALELGLDLQNRVIKVADAAFLDAINPLRQIPTLLLDGDDAVFDSRVICAYLASLRPGTGLIPPDIKVATRWAMVVGLMEAGVARQMERIRPSHEQSAGAILLQERRIATTITRLEADADAIEDGPLRIDRLSTAVALDYIDFRYPHEWRSRAPRLARWFERERERPAMVMTRPR